MTLDIQSEVSLKQFNTFGFDQKAEHFCKVASDAELEAAVAHAQQHELPITILGGGSNIVLTRDIPGMVIHPAYHQLSSVPTQQTDATVVQVGAGVVWDELVRQTLKNKLRGLENLTLIPGSVGAAPVQNIGAYGVEVGERIVSVRAFHIASRQWQEFTPQQCQFSYRSSFFKQHPGQYIITQVDFRLGDCNPTQCSYASLAAYLEAQQLSTPDAIEISNAVESIRSSRLPDPAKIGNAGSFFHNPVVENDQASDLQTRFPDLPVFPSGQHHSKLSAAWMIDNAGFKGVRHEGVGVYDKQALVLVNQGHGTGQQLMSLASQIQQHVRKLYDVALVVEPTII
ncbi:MAG: UDP-N-acetylmuramate dehydrogenase [Granulosicoccus sp.]